MKQCNLTKGLVVFLTIMITLFCGVMPSSGAQPGDVSDCDDCKNRNFEGCYGFSHTGDYIITVPENFPPATPPTLIDLQVTMVSNGVYHLDGNRGLTGEETVRLVFPLPSPLNYEYPPSFFTAQIIGTYDVNENCSGTASVCVTPDYPPLIPGVPVLGLQSEISFVIGSNGEEIIMTTVKMNTPCRNPLLPDEMGNVVPINIVGPVKKLSCDD